MRRGLALAGLVGGLSWISLAFFPPVGGPRGSEAYDYEVLWSRLLVPTLLGMLLGQIGLFIRLRMAFSMAGRIGFVVMLAGLALMALANFVEYWLLSDLSHDGPEGIPRGIAWMTFLLGTLILLVASAVVGVAMLRKSVAPKWRSLMFLLLMRILLLLHSPLKLRQERSPS